MTVTGVVQIMPTWTIAVSWGMIRATRSTRSTKMITSGSSLDSSTSVAVWTWPRAP